MDLADGSHEGVLQVFDGIRPEVLAERPHHWAAGASWWGTPGWRVYAPGPNPDERLIALDESGTVSYPHTDGLGSTIALSQGGTATAKYRYTAFGETPDGPGGYPWRYTGQRIDAFTGTYDFKAREYLPSWGRFVQPDPAMFVDGPNLYAYVGNRGVDRTDPSGECPWCLSGGIGAAVGGGASALAEMSVQYAQHGQITSWNRVGTAAAGGVVGGFITGVSGNAVAGGAAAGATTAVLNGERPVGIIIAAGVGAAVGKIPTAASRGGASNVAARSEQAANMLVGRIRAGYKM